MNALERYAQIARALGPQQQVPPGNPIAEYYGREARDLDTAAKGMAVGSGVVGGMSLVELLEGNPLALLGLIGGAGGLAGAGGALHHMGQQRQGTADMWFNRFGSGDPNQGLPGSPSGPAYRR